MKKISTDVNKIIYSLIKKQHPILAELVVNWGKIVGLKYSSKSYPVKIASSFNAGVKKNILYIAAVSSPASVELSYQSSLIMERIAIYLGYKAVAQIKIIIK